MEFFSFDSTNSWIIKDHESQHLEYQHKWTFFPVHFIHENCWFPSCSSSLSTTIWKVSELLSIYDWREANYSMIFNSIISITSTLSILILIISKKKIYRKLSDDQLAVPVTRRAIRLKYHNHEQIPDTGIQNNDTRNLDRYNSVSR